MKSNEIERQRISAATEQFLAAGGKIEVVPTHVFGERLSGAPRAMMTSAQRKDLQAKPDTFGAHWRKPMNPSHD